MQIFKIFIKKFEIKLIQIYEFIFNFKGRITAT